MDKLDETDDDVYEVDTTFSTATKKRPVATNKEEVSPTTMTYCCSVFIYTLVHALIAD